MSISASAVLSLQTRINNERSRRGLSSAGFTGGVTSGSNIRAPHINELRSYTETLNTMGSVSFGWSGNVAAGADITDALSQISSYCTTLKFYHYSVFCLFSIYVEYIIRKMSIYIHATIIIPNSTRNRYAA